MITFDFKNRRVARDPIYVIGPQWEMTFICIGNKKKITAWPSTHQTYNFYWHSEKWFDSIDQANVNKNICIYQSHATAHLIRDAHLTIRYKSIIINQIGSKHNWLLNFLFSIDVYVIGQRQDQAAIIV